MKRGLRAKMKLYDEVCNINMSEDNNFSEQDQLLLNELNRIICLTNNNPLLWDELSIFDLKLRDRLRIHSNRTSF